MALIKNFGIAGIGQTVQYGKGGGKVVYDTGGSLFKVTSDGTALTNLGVAEPTADSHAASKNYVDQVAQGLDVKDSVRVATSANIQLDNAPSMVDGVTLAQGDRVLVKAQTTASQNGIYVFSASGAEMERSDDMNAPGEFVGSFFFVEEGTANSDQGFVCSTNGTVTPDSTDITFSQFTGTGQITAGTGLSKVGNTISAEVDGEFITIINDKITMTGTDTTGEVLQSDGSGGVTYGAVNLATSVAGILPLAHGGLGVNVATDQAGARTNLGLGSMALQDSTNVNITGGTVDLSSSGTLTLANDQILGDKISGGTIDSASLIGGEGKTIGGFDITVGTGKTLSVAGILDVDGTTGSAIDNVAIGTTDSAAGKFSTLNSEDVTLTGGTINGTVIGGATPAAMTGTTIDANSLLKANTVTASTGGGDITFTSKIIASAGIDFGGASVGTDGITTDTIDEKTANAGVNVDGVVLKDAGVAATGVSTFADLTATTATINGGTIDETIIGGTTAAAGTFSTMTTADAAITGGAISGTDLNLSGQALVLDANQISGDHIDGGVISDFASIGIDDNVTPLNPEGDARTTTTILSLADTDATFDANLIVNGDLTVTGTTTTVNSTDTLVSDNVITLNAGELAAGVSRGTAGIEIARGSLDSATLQWNETDDVWEFKVGAVLADLKIGSQAMDAISVDTINELSPGSDINFGNNIAGTNATFATELFVPKISETVANNGVTIDEVLLKDGVVVGGLTAEAGDIVDVSAATSLVFAADQISGDSINGGTIDAITIDSLVASVADINGGTIDATTVGMGNAGSAAGKFSTLESNAVTLTGGTINTTSVGMGDAGSAAGKFTTMTTADAAITGGAINTTTVGMGVGGSAAGKFTTMTTEGAAITGGAISGASLTSNQVELTGGTINTTSVGMGVGGSAAGKFSTLESNNVNLTGGTADLATVTAAELISGNVGITGGSISGTSIDLSGQSLTLTADSVSGNSIHGGTISDANLTGATPGGSTMSGYDITVGANRTLDVSAGTLNLANGSIIGDKIAGGTISNFASTGIDDNATATKMTLTDTAATFAVAGDFGTNTLAAGATTLASIEVANDAVIHGNLTVSGSVVTTLSEEVAIEDNILLLNSNWAANLAPTENSGIEVNRGQLDNAKWYWDETADEWSSNGANINVGDITATSFGLSGEIATTDGGTGTDTSTFADDSLMKMSGSGSGVAELVKGLPSTVLKVDGAGTLGYDKVDVTTDITGITPISNGGTGLDAAGSEHTVLIANGSGALAYGYQGTLRDTNGNLAIDTSGMTTGAEYLDLANTAGRVTMTAKNASGTGLVDLYIQGQNGGDVFLVGQSGEAVLQGDDDTDLTVSGGNSDAAAAGDLILKGGNGGAAGISGDVIIKGGNGGATAGKTQVLGADDTLIATFVETSDSADDSLEIKNGSGGIELAAVGASTDVNLVLAPKTTDLDGGTGGMVMLPAGTEISFDDSDDMVVSTKKYVDDEIAKVGDNFLRKDFTATGPSSFTVGNIKDVAGKDFYVKSVTIKITTAFFGCDEITVSDGTNTFVSTLDVDMSETGLYVIEQGYEHASAKGATITATLGNSGSSASPTVGRAIVSVEYKAIPSPVTP
ncbi:hypothetical protein N9I00_00985 [bacterium]|nr:hypothetical protein [bacterium]